MMPTKISSIVFSVMNSLKYLKSGNTAKEAALFPDHYSSTQSSFQNVTKPGIFIFNESWLRTYFSP